MRTVRLAGPASAVALGALLLAALLIAPRPAGAQQDADLEYYWGDGCPVCEDAAQWLDALEDANPEVDVARYEVWYDEANQERFVETLAERGEEASGVPTFVVGDEVWVGFTEQIADDIEDELAETAGPSAADEVAASETADDEGWPWSTVILSTIGALGVVLAIVAVSRAGGGGAVKR
ncbi:MAG: glutaredoxin family protein [Actinomycetota bacterium]